MKKYQPDILSDAITNIMIIIMNDFKFNLMHYLTRIKYYVCIERKEFIKLLLTITILYVHSSQ